MAGDQEESRLTIQSNVAFVASKLRAMSRARRAEISGLHGEQMRQLRRASNSAVLDLLRRTVYLVTRGDLLPPQLEFWIGKRVLRNACDKHRSGLLADLPDLLQTDRPLKVRRAPTMQIAESVVAAAAEGVGFSPEQRLWVGALCRRAMTPDTRGRAQRVLFGYQGMRGPPPIEHRAKGAAGSDMTQRDMEIHLAAQVEARLRGLIKSKSSKRPWSVIRAGSDVAKAVRGSADASAAVQATYRRHRQAIRLSTDDELWALVKSRDTSNSPTGDRRKKPKK